MLECKVKCQRGDVEAKAASSQSSGRIPSSSRLSGVPEEDLWEAVNLLVQISGVDFNQTQKNPCHFSFFTSSLLIVASIAKY